jgi:hypothetical protein
LLKEDRPVLLAELHSTQLQRASAVTSDQFLDECRALGYQAHRLHSHGVGPPLDRAPTEMITSVALLPS